MVKDDKFSIGTLVKIKNPNKCSCLICQNAKIGIIVGFKESSQYVRYVLFFGIIGKHEFFTNSLEVLDKMKNDPKRFKDFDNDQLVLASGFFSMLDSDEKIALEGELKKRNLIKEIQQRYGEDFLYLEE